MRVLLDECVPRELAADLTGHAVRTVAEMGWSGMTNGRLFASAATQFDALVTVDVRVKSNRYADLRAAAPAIVRALETVQPGSTIVVAA